MDWKKLALGAGSAGTLLAAVVTFYEGVNYNPYQDVTGVWTSCSGNTHNVDPNHLYTSEECATINKDQEDVAFRYLHQAVKIPLSRNEAIAYSDFIYNEGIGTFKKSSMYKDLEANKKDEACKDLLKYNGVWKIIKGKRTWVVLRGLDNRRHTEYGICMTKEN